MAKRKLVLVDFNNLLFRSVFAHDTLSHRGIFTGGLYGAIDMVASTVNRYSIDRIMVCDDTKPYLRSEHYSRYKSDRADDKGLDEDRLKQVAQSRNLIRGLLTMLCVPYSAALGYEADDFIGHYCKTKSKRYSHIFVMSNDSDFYQLLSGRVFLCKTGGLYGRKDFRSEYPGIQPSQWPRCIALKGSHNGVLGIKGVGDKTAYKAVLEGMTDKEVFTKWRMRRSDIRLKTALATFPFPKEEDPPNVRIAPICYSASQFDEFCQAYGIKFRDEFHNAFRRLSR